MTIFSSPAILRPLVQLLPTAGRRAGPAAFGYQEVSCHACPCCLAIARQRQSGAFGFFHQQSGLKDWSDLELKAAIQQEESACADGRLLSSNFLSDQAARVFAIVNESINRRLGAWRILE